MKMSARGAASAVPMRVTTSVRRVRRFLTDVDSGALLLRPAFQRRLVWTDRDKVRFLDTVLKGYPFPEIYVAAGEVNTETAVGTEWLVDGQQRITTLYHYFTANPELKLGRDFPAYTALDDDQKIAFLEYEVVTRDLGAMDQDEILEVFERINATQYGLNIMEIHFANYHGEFKSFGETIANRRFFSEHRVFSNNEIRRMSDVGFALTFIITIMHTYFNRDSLIEEYLAKYNDDFDGKGDIEAEIERVFEFIEELRLPRQSRAWKRSDLLTLLVEVHRLLIRKRSDLNPGDVRERLSRFYDEVDNRELLEETVTPKSILDIYYNAAVQATNDRGNRIRRGEIIEAILADVPVEIVLL